MEISKRLELIKSYIVVKSYLNKLIYKALPIGTKRQRKSGTYQKQSDGSWVRIKNRSTEKNPYQNLPKDLKQLQPNQEKAIINSMQKEFSTHELKQRSNKLDKMIKKQEKGLNKRLKEMEKHGVDISKVKTPTLDNLKKAKAMHEKAIQGNLNPQKPKTTEIKKPVQNRLKQPSYNEAIKDPKNNQAQIAGTLAKQTGLKAEDIYNWGNKQGIDLHTSARGLLKDKEALIDSIKSGNKNKINPNELFDLKVKNEPKKT